MNPRIWYPERGISRKGIRRHHARDCIARTAVNVEVICDRKS